MATRVLLVDDHRMVRDGVRRSLEDHGLQVVGEAGDGQVGVRMAVALQPDVVLMDVSMPVLGGVEATRQLRFLAPSAEVVMLTMHEDLDVIARAIDAGAADYLVKTCSTGSLVRTIRLVASRQSPTSPAGTGREPVISGREAEVLQLIADGLTMPEVSARLHISAKTVKNHLASIYSKLEARDRTQAVLRAIRMGIVRLDMEDDRRSVGAGVSAPVRRPESLINPS